MGETENKGLEATLTWHAVNKKDWVTTIFGKSPVVLATIVAIVLNLTLPKTKK